MTYEKHAIQADKSDKMKSNAQLRTLSKDMNTALREVSTTITKMSEIFKAETKALNAVDSNSFAALQAEKISTAQEYQSDMGQIISRKNEVSQADPTLRDKLKQMQKDFSRISQENLEALSRMQRCTDKLGNTIRNAAIHAAQKQNGYSYGENGAISNAAKKKAVSSGLSETV